MRTVTVTGQGSAQVTPDCAVVRVSARHRYSLRCPTLDTAGALVTELAAQVGDRLQVEGVSLEVTDTSIAVMAAREAAYADAVARAEHLTSLAGLSLGDVQAVVEGGGVGGVAQAFDGAAYSARMGISFEPGEGSIGQTVTVTWAVL